ncbi:hypothetical protein Rru_A2963 [Rhodospirillum rubrum ATCC 11170]|uniref:Uncharacterized protein n=2 Tax=Rhodospirillum rubrum TaxID=1085 RepID=Q2RQ37_RHORT|nr:hypothetical protein Rru_A2963 [Rhodospirillum rubrum ATCC 11170]MBK5955437.1 hypothetical protein [Rhodospirillum rubrum]
MSCPSIGKRGSAPGCRSALIAAIGLTRQPFLKKDPAMSLCNHGPRALLAALVLLSLGGCGSSEPQWHKAGSDGARTRADYRACRALADDEAMRKSGAIHGEDVSDIGSSSDPMAQMTAYDARRIFQGALASCMRQRGYAKGASPTAGADGAVEGLRRSLSW